MYMLDMGQFYPLKIAFRKLRDPCQEGQAPRQRPEEEHLISCNVPFCDLCLDGNIGKHISLLSVPVT